MTSLMIKIKLYYRAFCVLIFNRKGTTYLNWSYIMVGDMHEVGGGVDDEINFRSRFNNETKSKYSSNRY